MLPQLAIPQSPQSALSLVPGHGDGYHLPPEMLKGPGGSGLQGLDENDPRAPELDGAIAALAALHDNKFMIYDTARNDLYGAGEGRFYEPNYLVVPRLGESAEPGIVASATEFVLQKTFVSEDRAITGAMRLYVNVGNLSTTVGSNHKHYTTAITQWDQRMTATILARLEAKGGLKGCELMQTFLVYGKDGEFTRDVVVVTREEGERGGANTYQVWYGEADELRRIESNATKYLEASEEYVPLYNLDKAVLIIDVRGNVSLEENGEIPVSLVTLEPAPHAASQGFEAPKVGTLGGPIVRPAGNPERKEYIFTLADTFDANYQIQIDAGFAIRGRIQEWINQWFGEIRADTLNGDPNIKWEIQYSSGGSKITGVKVTTNDQVRDNFFSTFAFYFNIKVSPTV